MTTFAHVSLSHLTLEALIGLAGLGIMALAAWLLFNKSNLSQMAVRRVKAVYRRFDR